MLIGGKFVLPPPPVFRDGDPVIKKAGDGRPVPAPRPRKGPALNTGNANVRKWWPRHRECRKYDSYFFQTGKTQSMWL